MNKRETDEKKKKTKTRSKNYSEGQNCSKFFFKILIYV